MRNVLLVVGLTSIVLFFLYAANLVNQSKQSANSTNTFPTQTPAVAGDNDSLVETVAASYQNPFETLINPEASQSAVVAYPLVQLGNCSNAQECYTYCLVPKNTPACWSYGSFVLNKQVLGASTSTVGGKETILRCSQDPTCSTYCQKNPDRCLGYSRTEQNYLGPSGCTSVEECQSFCEDHPSLCPGFESPKPTIPSSTDNQIFCTQDVQECPNGTYVTRSGPNCEFAPCP